MEDQTLLSPWNADEDEIYTTKQFLFLNKPDHLKSSQQRNSLKPRTILTESDDGLTKIKLHKKQPASIFRKKGQSTSSYQNVGNNKQGSIPFKLELKLVSYPIQEKQKQKIERYSQKIDQKDRNILKSKAHEFIRTLFNYQVKNVSILKQRPSTKVMLKGKTFKKGNMDAQLKQNDIKNKKNKLKHYFRCYHQREQVARKDLHEQNSIVHELQKEQLNKLDQSPLRKKLLSRNKYSPYYLSKNSSKSQINIAPLENQHNFKSVTRQLNRKRVQAGVQQKKLSVQRLQNINCFKDNTNVFTHLQQQNRVLFNELEKYNLFGLRNLKVKQRKKK